MAEESHLRALKGGGGGQAADLDFPHFSLGFVICSWIAVAIHQCGLRYYRSKRIRKDGDGIFVLDEWSETVRMIVSFKWVFLICIPAALLTNGWVFGGLMALVEGWSLDDGYYYVIANFLGLFNPLTSANPDTTMGDYLALVLSIYALIVTNTFVGFITMLQWVIWQSDAVPDTTGGLLRYVLVYIPVGLLAFGAAVGGLAAAVEKWSYEDGFLHMAGTLCAIANPIDDETIDTQSGMFIESYCACLNLGVMAMVIQIVTQHPHFFDLVKLFEGKFSGYFENRQMYVAKYAAEQMHFQDEELRAAKDDADSAVMQIHKTHFANENKDNEMLYNYMKCLEDECKKVQAENKRLKKRGSKTMTPKSSVANDAEEHSQVPGTCNVNTPVDCMKAARDCENIPTAVNLETLDS